MSTPDAQHSEQLNAQNVSSIANLARLSLDETQSTEYAQSLNKILAMMEHLKSIDTDGIEPLKSPFDHAQPLREDRVIESLTDQSIETESREWVIQDLMGSDCEAGKQAFNIILKVMAEALSGKKSITINPQEYSEFDRFAKNAASLFAKNKQLSAMLRKEIENESDKADEDYRASLVA